MSKKKKKNKHFSIDHDVFRDTYEVYGPFEKDGFTIDPDKEVRIKASSESELKVMLAVNGISEDQCEYYEVRSFF